MEPSTAETPRPSKGRPDAGRRLGQAAGVATLGLIAIGILLRLRGSQISFWMDEAWVANSLLAASWKEVFFYPPWLQTSPPGFLALARSAIEVFGWSHLAFRSVPLLSSVVGLAALAVVSRRALPPLFSLLPVTLVVFSPTAIQYARMLKQYSTEQAVGAVLLLAAWWYWERRTSARYWALFAVTAGGMLCSYGAVFVVGGVLLLLSPAALLFIGARPGRVDITRWLALGAAAASILAIEYAYFYLPNTSPALKEFWALVSFQGDRHDPLQLIFRHLVVYARHAPLLPGGITLAVLLGVVLATVGMLRAVMSPPDDVTRRNGAAVICLAVIPAVVLIASGIYGLYPNSGRTSLVLLPGMALMAGFGAQACHEWTTSLSRAYAALRPAGWLSAGAWASGLLMLLVHGSLLQRPSPQPFEDYNGAIELLQSSVADEDIIFVHACCEEGFRLYRTIDRWTTAASILTGTTGQPCCPRTRAVAPFPTDEQVRQDLAGRLPLDFAGRVWILANDRPEYWRNASGRDEGPLLAEGLMAAGCTFQKTATFTNMSVRVFDCSRRGARRRAGEPGSGPAKT